jgi:SAM-dependent methyltransferase
MPGHGLQVDHWLAIHERQLAMVRLFARLGWSDLSTRRVLEIGCGDGANLLDLLRMGFTPRNLAGIEATAERFARAMQSLPAGVILMQGDPSLAKLPDESEDVVMLFGVFSSLLDAPFQWRLAQTVWRWVRPEGGVLWYDTAVGDAHDPAVRAVPLERIRELFPAGEVRHLQKITLTPPLARRACRWHPMLYSGFNLIPWLRSHVLAWIAKPAS